MNKTFYYILLLSLFCTRLYSQDSISGDLFVEDSTEVYCNHKSINLGYGGYGLSFGNSQYHNGIRINFSDCGVKEINGINITFWKPGRNPNLKINGAAIGIAPFASSIRGINFGLAASVTRDVMFGFNFGGLALVSDGTISGISIGGLAAVAQDDMTGINMGGLALVSQSRMRGLNMGGLALVAEDEIIGLNISSLAIVSQSNLKGINITGMANVSQGNIYGLNFAGIANVAQNKMEGINLGGLALVAQEGIKGVNIGGAGVVSEDGDIVGLTATIGKIMTYSDIKGVAFAGYKTEANKYYGVNFSVCWTEVEVLKGISFSGYNRITEQYGLSIGLFNVAEILNGIQIGLLNIADNNPIPFKVLPFINMNL